MSTSSNGAARSLVFARGLLFWLFALYSGALVVTELVVSREVARTFFQDLRGSTPLEGINTIFSVSFLWACALVFFICTLALEEGDKRLRTRYLVFYWSQALFFLHLGADDRFTIHERLGRWLGLTERGVPDALILASVGTVEVGVLLLFRDLWNRPGRARTLLGLAVLASGLMILIDALVPTGAPLQLSSEDLLKLWGAIFFFLFSLETLHRHLQELKHRARRHGPDDVTPVSPGQRFG